MVDYMQENNHSGARAMCDDSICKAKSVEVRQGDSIWAIAGRIYGDNHHLAAVYEANHLLPRMYIDHGQRHFVAPTIHPGETIVIPDMAHVASLEAKFQRHYQTHRSHQIASHQPYPRYNPVSDESRTSKGSSDNSKEVAIPLTGVTTSVSGKTGGYDLYGFSAFPVAHAYSPILSPGGFGANESKPSNSGDSSDKDVQAQVAKTLLGAAASEGDEISLQLARIGKVGAALANGIFIGGFRDGYSQCTNDPLGTSLRFLTAGALGVGFGLAAAKGGFANETASIVGIGLTSVAAWDFVNPWQKGNQIRNSAISRDLGLIWNFDSKSEATIRGVTKDLEFRLGRPSFDFLLCTAGGYLGSSIAGPLSGHFFPPGPSDPKGPRLNLIVDENLPAGNSGWSSSRPNEPSPEQNPVTILGINVIPAFDERPPSEQRPKLISNPEQGPKLIRNPEQGGPPLLPAPKD